MTLDEKPSKKELLKRFGNKRATQFKKGNKDRTAEKLIDKYLQERFERSAFLTGKEVSALSSKQHIFIDGRHAIVIDVTVDLKRKTGELIYVVGRKAFGREQYLEVPFSNIKTNVQRAIAVTDSTSG